MCCLHADNIIIRALKENILDVEDGWSQNFQDMIRKLSDHTITLLDDHDKIIPVNKKHIMDCVADKVMNAESRKYEYIVEVVENISGCKVRACPNHMRDGFKAFKCKMWFQDDNLNMPILSFVHHIADIRTLARFRCGTHWLATEVNRSDDVGRSDRLCLCCNNGEREDELHIFFCEAYSNIKSLFPAVFESEAYLKLLDAYMNNSDELDKHMNHFMNVTEDSYINALAGFLRKSIKIRKDLINA